jgi:hypothetical protein
MYVQATHELNKIWQLWLNACIYARRAGVAEIIHSQIAARNFPVKKVLFLIATVASLTGAGNLARSTSQTDEKGD